ncbi:hypothetical protein [Salinivibrio phage CW02]|uniref:DUF4314 domain-containing protein n=1 Tax=Salinivibrio phage CW02 TaxID=1161935 RepID=H9D1C5_9CAUD|nr:hypothetical protein F490_gp70 [Salinivibrio phage CW02]AFE86167.1 hypothetical protein [Salinivibrio phage CW02]
MSGYEFEVGQRVILVNIKDYLSDYGESEYFPDPSNTVGNVGTVLPSHAGRSLRVQWDNGARNAYHKLNLAPILLEENI